MAIEALVDRFLAHHATFFPVDATFMGLAGANERLPPADPEAASREAAALDALRREFDAAAIADSAGRHPARANSAGARLDARMLRGALIHARAALEHRPRFGQPSWYTGEAAFGLISLLLPSAPPDAAAGLHARLAAIPAFLDAGRRNLAGKAVPPDWCERARREAAAVQRLLAQGLPHHPLWRDSLATARDRAAAALASFAASLAGLPPADPACGRDYLALLMREVHGLPWTPEEAVALAEDAFARLEGDLERRAAEIDPARDWRAQLAALATETREADVLPRAYGHWHDRALTDATGLVTPADDYSLTFAPLPAWAQAIAGDLYFLSYRSPPALDARMGSVYWTAPAAQSVVAIKQTHATHHGSVGHHTQNARARCAPSRLARLAGTDCAAGIAFLGAGTMVEGWACYATELLAEIDDYYAPAETLALIQGDRRNAASVIADIRLHTGEWSLERMRAFYRDEAGFPAARIWGETTRNSLLPATRLMYFLGTEQIKALRRRTRLPLRNFHDALIGCGHVPVAWAAEEIERAA
ncbi:MAG: DUF885 family protein [Alphaproteobacteria bacterium]|nr:DUF885 family protein [Alphaproteobacteria bacterium]